MKWQMMYIYLMAMEAFDEEPDHFNGLVQNYRL